MNSSLVPAETIADRYLSLKNEIEKASVTLVAVSKTKPIQDLMQAYDAGCRHFGENKVQEMCDKYDQMPKDICWHMIGHLQRNKVKYMAPFVYLIHGVDSLSLLEEINKQAAKVGRIQDCLLQVHIAQEETKFGFGLSELIELIESTDWTLFSNVRIRGLMGMASFTDDSSQVQGEFQSLKQLFDSVQNMALAPCFQVDSLSMGMSGDYQIAMELGSTHVRIGSSIFGGR
jgi:PLP dependent protein